jgi:hypothetical protein
MLQSKDKGSFKRAVTSSLAVLAVAGGIVCDVDERELSEVRVVEVTDDSVGGEGVSVGLETLMDSGGYL